MGCANYAIGLYGVRVFLDDLDNQRAYYAEAQAGVIAAVLDFAATTGFTACVGQHGFTQYPDAHAWRQRYLIARK